MSQVLLKVLVIIAIGCGLIWGAVKLLENPVADLPDTELETVASAAATTVLMEKPLTSAWLESLPDYAGSQSCIDCHSGICDTYKSHPMSRSLARTIEAPVIEDYTNVTSFDGPVSGNYDIRFKYSVIREADKVIHREMVTDSTGNLLGEVDADVKYAVGSGKRGRSYLIEHGGRLYMSPVTWYTEGQRWDLSPSYSRDNKHFERRIISGCVVCHASLSVPDTENPNVFVDPIFKEESIGCERCHGPGRRHVEHRRQFPDQSEGDPIVNPADLTPELRNSICYQCHLQGVGRVTRYGKSEFDFHPGVRVTDVWTIFVRGTKVSDDNTTAAVGQAEQMLASRCFDATGGQLSCLSCHDPHLVPEEHEEADFYRRKCQTCHDGTNRPDCAQPLPERQKSVPDDSCIACHMPALSANDVPHTSQTDHRIPRFLRASEESAGKHSEPAPWEVFANDGGQIPQEEVDRALGILLARNALGARDRFLASRAIPLLQSWLTTHPDDLEVAETLGSAYSVINDTVSARNTWEAALKYHPGAESLLLHLMVVCHDSEDFDAGIEYGQQLIQVNPWHSQHFTRLTHMLGQKGRIREGVQMALRAVELKPWDFQIHGWLADSYELLGDRVSSDKHLQLYEKLKPLKE